MKHQIKTLAFHVSATAISFALIFSSTPLTEMASAQTPNHTLAIHVKQDMEAQIKRDGRLPSAAYHSLIHTQFGNGKTIPANLFAAASSPGNTVTQVGDQPPGTGQTFFWDRKDDQALLVAFINAASPYGLTISGMQNGDSLEFRSGEGLASFAKDQGHPDVQSFLGLLATAGKGVALYEEDPKYLPIISELETKAKALFNATGDAELIRDVYGVDPSNQLKARGEGGIIFCLPQAMGPYYPGDSDHQNFWIKPDGTRDQAHMPPQIQTASAFFPLRGSPSLDQMTATIDGEAYVVPWDCAFADNAGFYKVFIILHKGSGPVGSGTIFTKKGQGSGGGSRVSDGTHRVRQ